MARWSPHQLRHAAATRYQHEGGWEEASAPLLLWWADGDKPTGGRLFPLVAAAAELLPESTVLPERAVMLLLRLAARPEGGTYAALAEEQPDGIQREYRDTLAKGAEWLRENDLKWLVESKKGRQPGRGVKLTQVRMFTVRVAGPVT